MLLALSQGFFGPIHYIGTSIMYSSTCLLKQDAKMHIEVIMYAFAIVSDSVLALNFIFHSVFAWVVYFDRIQHSVYSVTLDI